MGSRYRLTNSRREEQTIKQGQSTGIFQITAIELSLSFLTSIVIVNKNTKYSINLEGISMYHRTLYVVIPWWVSSHWSVGWSLLERYSTLWDRLGLRSEGCGAAGCRLACIPVYTSNEASTAKSGPGLHDMARSCHRLHGLPARNTV